MFEIYEIDGIIGNGVNVQNFAQGNGRSIREKYEITPEEGGQILKDYGWGVIFESDSESPNNYACGPHLMAIDVIGTITKCGFFTEQNIGNIFDLGLKKSWELIQKNLNWCLSELKCKEINCQYIGDCRGGCRYRGYRQSGDLHGIDEFKCYQFGKLK